MNDKLRLLIKIVNKTVITATIVIMLFMAIFTVPRLFHIKPFVVLSGSMEPTIPTASVVFVDTTKRDVKIGDVITFSLSTGANTGVYVTHRVNDIVDGLIQTKGDNNDNADGYIEPDAVTGTVMTHIPYVGLILDFLQKQGFVLVAIWVFAANAITAVLNHFTETEETENTDKHSKTRSNTESNNTHKPTLTIKHKIN